MDPEVRKSLWNAGRYSAVGLEMGISVSFGLFIGWLVDKKFETAPWGAMIGVFFGLGAAGMALYRVYKSAKEL